uniref:Uncharacterized protein AlNc14C514G12013 n=1 Tax=Albugo laibachii Nc14 TaxID=890382 RepID=F0X0R9_9STRA|nr:conserved hypothetical protein [Albugo laibachii Nc14]|eukprot:CCA27363.1 conserved hypothetical protein [Albugo laibachii Nc14]
MKIGRNFASTRGIQWIRNSSSSVSSDSSPNFSFSGAGFLISYHLGVAVYLQEKNLLTSKSKVAGASGGAITALAIAADQDLVAVQNDVKAMAALCRSEGTWGRLEPRLRHLFKERFYSSVDIDQLSERLTIVTQQIWPKWELLHADKFDSVDDLYGAIVASCHVPFYLTRQFWTPFRGHFYIDGGLYNIVPEMPGYTKVCVFHAHLLRRLDYNISPSIDPEFPFTIWELARFALFPPEAFVLDQIFELGKKSATLWVENEDKAKNSQ